MDHELTGSVAGALTSGGGSGFADEDPLGLGRRIEYVRRIYELVQSANKNGYSMSEMDMESSASQRLVMF